MTTSEKVLLARELENQGYSVSIDRWPTKATYYKPDGEALPNLPADPRSMQRYMARGLSLAPPKPPVVAEAPAFAVPPEAVESAETTPPAESPQPVKAKRVRRKKKPKKGGK